MPSYPPKAQNRVALCGSQFRAFAIGVAFLASLLWLSPGAEAQPNRLVVIIDAGDTDLFVESMVRANIEAEMVNRGYTIARGVSVAGDIPARLLSCSGDLECTKKILSPVGVEHVLFLSLRSEEDRDVFRFRMVARDFDVPSGEVVARTMQKCEDCQLEVDLAAFCARVVKELYRIGEVAPPTPVQIDPKEPPSGTPPRPRPLPAAVSQEAERTKPSYAKYLGLAGGIAAIATGAVLVVIDGPVIESGVRQAERYDTKNAGYITMGAGLVLVGIGVGLWALEEEEQGEAVSASLVPTTTGAMLHFSGGF